MVLASLGAVRGGDGKRLAEPIGVAVIDPKDGKLIYKLTPLRPLLDIAAIWGRRFVLLGCYFRVFRSRSASKLEKERLKLRSRALGREKGEKRTDN